MRSIQGRWTPATGILNHTGGPIGPEAIFFAPPPPEIGDVISASSGVRTGRNAVFDPVPAKAILLFLLFGCAVGAFMGAGLTQGSLAGAGVGALLGAALITGPFYLRECRRNDCTYVGTMGIARISAASAKRAEPRAEIFLFSGAASLYTALLGRNSGTNFDYRWRDSGGRILYRLHGGYYGSATWPDPSAAFHFARAAEAAWTCVVSPAYQEQLQRTGGARFVVKRGITGEQTIEIQRGGIVATVGNSVFRATAAEIGDVLLDRGWIAIQRTDARPRGRPSTNGEDGVLLLSYATVPNVLMFLGMLKGVAGVAWRHGA